jgi:hypothetical protein
VSLYLSDFRRHRTACHCSFRISEGTVQPVAVPFEIHAFQNPKATVFDFIFSVFLSSSFFKFLYNEDGTMQPVSVFLVPEEICSIAMIRKALRCLRRSAPSFDYGRKGPISGDLLLALITAKNVKGTPQEIRS